MLRGELADLPRDDEICDEFKRFAASDGILRGDEMKFDIARSARLVDN